MLVWDKLNVHQDRRLREFIDDQDWITAFHLPPYAPDLNPVEGIWSPLRRTSQANTAFTDPDHLMSRNDVIDGCLAATGLVRTTGTPP